MNNKMYKSCLAEWADGWAHLKPVSWPRGQLEMTLCGIRASPFALIREADCPNCLAIVKEQEESW